MVDRRRGFSIAALTVLGGCSLFGSSDSLSGAGGSGSAPEAGSDDTIVTTLGDGGDAGTTAREAGSADAPEGVDAASPFADPERIAMSVVNPRSLVVQPSTGDVFWIQHGADGHGTINRFAAGATASSLVYSSTHNPDSITVDDTHLYWSSDDPQYQEVDWAPIVPGTLAAFAATGGAVPVGLAVDQSRFYWGYSGGGFSSISYAPKSTPMGTVGSISLDDNPVAMALDPSSHVLAAADESATVSFALTTQAQPVFATIATGHTVHPGAMAVRGNEIFWATTDGSIWSADPVAPVAAHVVADGQGTVAGIAIDDTRVYWTMRRSGAAADNGEVRCLSLPIANGATPITIASGQTMPSAIVTSSTGIFWLNLGQTDTPTGSVMLIRK